jgi:hypothetical protein
VSTAIERDPRKQAPAVTMAALLACLLSAPACSHAGLRLHGEKPRLLILERAQSPCDATPVLLFALFDTRAAFRVGDPCLQGDAAYRVVKLQADDWQWLRENIAYNPLVHDAPAEIDYCPTCTGRRALVLAMQGQGGRMWGISLRNPCSGQEMAAQFATTAERYGAQAAEQLVCSVDRLVDAMPARWSGVRVERWPKGEPLVRKP